MKARSLISAVLILGVWQAIVSMRLFSPLLLPSPFAAIYAMLNPSLLPDLGITLFRLAIGLLGGIIFGVLFGLIMGYSKLVYEFLEFPVEFLRAVPATALIPLAMLFFGNGSKIFLAVEVSTLLIAVQTIYGVRHASRLRIQAAQSMGLKGFRLFRKVIFPEALPHIIARVRIALSMALVVVVVTEMFMGSRLGLGERLANAHYAYNIKEMYAVIILIGIIGFALNRAFLVLERRLVHWAGKA